jgi:hypothetical protein
MCTGQNRVEEMRGEQRRRELREEEIRGGRSSCNRKGQKSTHRKLSIQLDLPSRENTSLVASVIGKSMKAA